MISQLEEDFARSTFDEHQMKALEHRFSQCVTLKCPWRHTIGTFTARTVPASFKWDAQIHQGQATETGRSLEGPVYRCMKCRHAGRNSPAAFPSTRSLCELVAAMHAYGLSHRTVTADTAAVLAKARGIVPADDPFSTTRAEYLARLTGGETT